MLDRLLRVEPHDEKVSSSRAFHHLLIVGQPCSRVSKLAPYTVQRLLELPGGVGGAQHLHRLAVRYLRLFTRQQFACDLIRYAQSQSCACFT